MNTQVELETASQTSRSPTLSETSSYQADESVQQAEENAWSMQQALKTFMMAEENMQPSTPPQLLARSPAAGPQPSSVLSSVLTSSVDEQPSTLQPKPPTTQANNPQAFYFN